MGRILRSARRFFSSEDGATATEYAVMLALIAAVVIGAVAAMGTKVSSTFADAEQGL